MWQVKAAFEQWFEKPEPRKGTGRNIFPMVTVKDLSQSSDTLSQTTTCAGVAMSIKRLLSKSTRKWAAELGVLCLTMFDHMKKDLVMKAFWTTSKTQEMLWRCLKGPGDAFSSVPIMRGLTETCWIHKQVRLW
jgi:hypothetical protein